MKWTDERKQALRTMWKAGVTSGDIAAELGGVTRNAVMGMVHRLGLMGSPEHAAAMKGRLTGCCAPGRAGTPLLEAAVVEHVVPAAGPDVAEAKVPTSLGADPDAGSGRDVVPGEVASSEGASLLADADRAPPWEVADGPAVTPEIAAAMGEVRAVEVAEDPLPSSGPAIDPAAVGDDEADAEDPDDDADDDPRLAALLGALRPRGPAPSVRPTSSVVDWRRSSTSRMPPRRSDVPPPREVSISSGVMATAVSFGRQPDWSDAFSLLEQLTGVPYDERVPGHVPALVAIATVMAKGDPRMVLSPRIPEQSVLRVMRSFAERGAVVAGKPPTRWMQDVDDRKFYEEMLALDAA